MTNRTAQKQRAIVATLLMECPPDLPESIAKLLSHAPEAFDDQRLGKVAQKIRELHRAGKSVYPASIQREFEDVDGGFITGLSYEALPLPLAEADAQTIWEAYRTRRRATIIGEANDELVTRPDRADAIAANVARCLAELEQEHTTMAYVPGKQGEETEVFVREHLQPIATELRVGVVAIHHTPKIGRQNGVGTGANEYERQYNSAGKAEVVNAFRAILNIMPVGNGVFKFTADKRGRKIGWSWEEKPTIERYFKHACDPDNPDLVWWRDATPEEAEQAANAEMYQDILKALPEHDEPPVSRERVHEQAKRVLKIGKHKADDWLKLAFEDELVDRVQNRNANGRTEAMFRRANGG
jgi:hypothetical protein